MLFFVPKILREILENLPTVIFKSVNIKEILIEAGPFILGFTKKEITSENKRLMQSIPENIIIDKATGISINEVDGETILRLYFSQLLNPNGLILDLGHKHFSKKKDKVVFSPNNTWYHLQEDFRLGLLNLYQGFYTDNDDLYTKGLYDLGLATGLDQEKLNELKILFSNHFGLNQSQLRFKLENFNDSFTELFQFFLRNYVKIKTDFIFLGVYLITLYLNLEKIDGTYNVKSIYKEIILHKNLN